jgi:hypothetical protein
VITDHENMDGKQEEGLIEGVVTLVGTEINRPHSHYLALDLEKPLPSNADNPQLVIDQVRQAGGFGIIAHPFEIGCRYVEKGTAYPWKHWPVFNFDGLEIWNFSSHWRGCHPSLFRAMYWYFVNRNGAMSGPPPDGLKLWDCYNRNGHRVIGIGGSDAHAFNYRLGPFSLKLFEYEYCFKTVNTYLVMSEKLSSDFMQARQQIYRSLRAGNCYISFDSLNPGSGMVFEAYIQGKQDPVLMGGEAAFSRKSTFKIKSPSGRPLIRLIRNSVVLTTTEESELSFQPEEPGLYRVEIFHRPLLGKPRPWVYSNPILLK